MSSFKKASVAAVLSLAVIFGSGAVAVAEANPDGVVRTYNTYPGRITGMVAPNAQVSDGTFTSTDGKGTQVRIRLECLRRSLVRHCGPR